MHKMAHIPAALLVLAMLVFGSASVYAAHPALEGGGKAPNGSEATAGNGEQTRTEQRQLDGQRQPDGERQTGADSESKARHEGVRLSAAQQQELSALYNDIFEKKKTVIRKYVEFGVMPADKGQKIIVGMEKRLDQLKERGYVPNWKKCRKGESDHHDHHGMH